MRDPQFTRMLLQLSLLYAIFLASNALEEVPRASGIKSAKTALAANKQIRRAPIVSAEGLSLVPHAHRMSTGLRRAPNGAAVPHPKIASRPAVRMVRPAAPAQVPMFPLQIPLLNLASQPGRPGLPTLPPLAFPALPTFPTLPPGPNGPITLAPMPTMPGLTMPPSFQRLLGITTPSPAPERIDRHERREESVREEKQYDDERAVKTKKRGLSTVSSRLSKYVDNDDDVVSPEKNADWIVPF